MQTVPKWSSVFCSHIDERHVCSTLRSIISCSSCTMSSLRLSCRVDILCSSSSLRCLTEETSGNKNITSCKWQQRKIASRSRPSGWCFFQQPQQNCPSFLYSLNQGQYYLRSRSSASKVGFCWPLSGGGWDASSCWMRSRWISCRISL